MSNLGRWDRWFSLLGKDPEPFGLSETYQLGADFLAPCKLVEDWGAGKGWFRRYVPPNRYRAIDGSRSPFADVIADLAEYRSDAPGIFIRHVLEHDYRWQKILANAVASFRERLVLIVFTPLVPKTTELTFAPDPGVPDLAFSLEDITGHFVGLSWRHETLSTPTQYGSETIFYVERAPSCA